MNEDDCNVFDPMCQLGRAASSALGDAIQNFANAVLEMFGKSVASLGAVWLAIGTPNLTSSGGASSIPAGTAPPGSGAVVTLLGYMTWIGLAVAAIAMVWLGVLIAASVRRGEGALNVGRLGLVLGGVVMIAAAGSLIGGLLPAGPRGAGGATLFIQSALWWYMGALAVLSVIVAGIRMAWENRADPGKDLIKSLLTLLVVAGAGVTFTQLFITASDAFAVWLLRGSLECDVAGDKACFGKNVALLLTLGANPGTGTGLGAMLVIILGIIASLAAFLQIVLMVARSGMLVILAGTLPMAAAATNTEAGKGWFRKCVGWLVAFLLYKPAAAVVYAAAFQLVGTNVFRDDDALVSVLTGLMLMILALVALPALMRFVTPLVGSLSGGAAGGAVAVGAMAALPSGAAPLGRLMAGSSVGGSSSGGPSSSSQPSGAARTAGGSAGGAQAGQHGYSASNGHGSPSGAYSGSRAMSGGGSSAASPSGATNGSTHPAAASGGGNTQATAQAAQGPSAALGAGAGRAGNGSPRGSTQAAAQAAQGTGATGAGAGQVGGGGGSSQAAAGAAKGSNPGPAGAGAGTASGATGGPVGMAAAEGAARAGEAGRAASSAAREAAQDATGEGGEPSGNG